MYKDTCKQTLRKSQLEIMKMIGNAADSINEKCYVVGGLVRDCIIGIKSDDLDFVCSDPFKIVEELKKQSPSTVKELQKSETTRFKSKIVHIKDPVKGIDEKIDFVEPRKESYVKDPKKLRELTGDITLKDQDTIKPIVAPGTFKDDVERRDFTLNALYLGIGKNDWLDIIDLTGRGIHDLNEKILDTPLDPDKTFEDDPSRMLRGIRFAACRKMHFHPRVASSIQKNAKEIHRVPSDLIHKEIVKGGGCDNYYEIMNDMKLLDEIFPEVTALKGLPHNKVGHKFDPFDHTILTLQYIPNDYKQKLAMLLHDTGKAKTTDVEGHAYGHAKESKEISENILSRLSFSNDEISYITSLIENHHIFHDLSNTKDLQNKTIRKIIGKYNDILPELEIMTRADIYSDHPNPMEQIKKLDSVLIKVNEVRKEMNELISKKFKLEINGNDLIQIGMKPSPKFKEILNNIEQLVVEGTLPNDNKILKQYVKDTYK